MLSIISCEFIITPMNQDIKYLVARLKIKDLFITPFFMAETWKVSVREVHFCSPGENKSMLGFMPIDTPNNQNLS